MESAEPCSWCMELIVSQHSSTKYIGCWVSDKCYFAYGDNPTRGQRRKKRNTPREYADFCDLVVTCRKTTRSLRGAIGVMGDYDSDIYHSSDTRNWSDCRDHHRMPWSPSDRRDHHQMPWSPSDAVITIGTPWSPWDRRDHHGIAVSTIGSPTFSPIEGYCWTSIRGFSYLQ